MIQKCDGVKILDLEEKLEATGGEYIVTAEKDGSQISISGDGSIYIQKVLGSDTYSARLNPTEGLIFAKNSLTTKTYANV